MATLIIENMGTNGLMEFFKGLTKECYPETHQLSKEHCLECGCKVYDTDKDEYDPNKFHTEDGRLEFHISQLCEDCWDELMREEE
jgi:hypothetical protein